MNGFEAERLEKRAVKMYGETDWVPHLTEISEDRLVLRDRENLPLAVFTLKRTVAGIRMIRIA